VRRDLSQGDDAFAAFAWERGKGDRVVVFRFLP
jgi:hypothetical protein